MTSNIEATLETERASDIPTIGQRKRVRVNGKFETMTVNAVNVSRSNDWSSGKRKDWYRAKVTFGGFLDV